MGYRVQCPGVTSYGKGHNLTSVHVDGCCEKFDALPADERERLGWKIPAAGTGDDPFDLTHERRILTLRAQPVDEVFDAVIVHHNRDRGTAPPLSIDPGRPTGDDCLTALLCIDSARDRLDLQELCLIAWARADGRTWDQIGRALGYSSPARQGASARYDKLRERFPDYQPPAPKKAP